MLDIRFIRENPDAVKENIKKKFQDAKLPLVDEVIELDAKRRAAIAEADQLRSNRNTLSKQIGMLMGQAKKDPSKLAEAEAVKAQVKEQADRLAELEKQETELEAALHKDMLLIPQMIDDSVPLGPDDSCNVEVERFGEAKVPDFPIPYHTEIMESFGGIDLDAAGRVSGNGFYYLLGDIARLHEAVLAYGRDFMINKGFTYCIPPFMIHGNVVEGVMSQTDMEGMMYKIEGEDLYLIGTSEHSMIGRFIDQILPVESLPQTLTSYSPCFRKEKGAHGIEERGVYRIHQFEKQEMIVVCKPEESKDWYEKLWRYSVELFRSLDIPVRQLECCSGDLADLKVKSCDIEAWSPRQQKFFEVCSCSNLGDAQARRLRIRYKDENGKMQLCHTLNNTCVAPPRMLIAFLENNLQADGTVVIPEVLRPYMGGTEKLVPKK
ncbi:serine--tRNA ligase [Dysosmobacter sp.]|uniref:serine--tRNA ligase n=2 Tax=Dysosmobacter sp. TaxID=2591382 RepID=UPI001BB4773B|nr:serine--tRNA ligase [Dysosmobacter sp.]MCI6053907.1 serine--tRNA ligase [Dysosmobacter sp.]MDY5511350.1 serine--tRNA ligase [Dysosmobacter sp.]QUO36693.1 serine--tRNA ligase [Dysosmobacter sp. Marseille-Q4140]